MIAAKLEATKMKKRMRLNAIIAVGFTPEINPVRYLTMLRPDVRRFDTVFMLEGYSNFGSFCAPDF